MCTSNNDCFVDIWCKKRLGVVVLHRLSAYFDYSIIVVYVAFVACLAQRIYLLFAEAGVAHDFF